MSSLNRCSHKCIQRLDERVVNRISAGEVIHRPVNVVKELMENSLDAKSTSIDITVRDGGMKSIAIQDNGSGIAKEDLDIVCERFTTSKLQSFQDLSHIQTFGFRGEALAAISHISYVDIQSKTGQQLCAFKLQFIDGKPKSSPVPLAANNGTVITVENLFYNLLQRKKALNSYSNEYNLILDLITKYAINNSNRVSFSLKKFGSDCDLRTNISNKTIENIRALYGTDIGNNLIEICFEDRIGLKFSVDGFVSNLNVCRKKFSFILFINERLVDCPALKKAIYCVYSNYLLKGFHSFVYLNIRIDSNNTDVNVDPTKSEVHFLHEQEICEQIVRLIESKLTNRSTNPMKRGQSLTSSQTSLSSAASVVTQSVRNVSSNESNEEKKNSIESKANRVSKSSSKSPKASTPIRPEKQIRTDSKERKINEFLLTSKKVVQNRREFRLKSLLELRASVANQTDPSLQELITNSTFVGCVDSTYLLIQYNTQLILVNGLNLSRELFRQLFLIDFGNFSEIKFSKPILMRDLIDMYLESSCGQSVADRETQMSEIETNLISNREMIFDYFSIEISEAKELMSFPILLDGFEPNFAFLPKLLYCLGKDVNWKQEKQCFDSFGRVLSEFYANPPNGLESERELKKWTTTVRTILYPSYKSVLCPPKRLSNESTFYVTTNVSDLYKVFERC